MKLVIIATSSSLVDLEKLVDITHKLYGRTHTKLVAGQPFATGSKISAIHAKEIVHHAFFFSSSSRGYRLLVSCNYGPAGNFRNSTARPSRTGRPFERNGPPCAECPQGDTCVNNLCMNAARGDVIPATSTQPPRSTTQPPRSTTQPPRSTTQPPRSTTQPPSSSTTRPTSPTSSPPTSTYPPPVTDTPYTTSSATSTMGTTTANPNAGRCNIYREYTQALVAYRTEITKWTRQFQAWKKAQSYSNN